MSKKTPDAEKISALNHGAPTLNSLQSINSKKWKDVELLHAQINDGVTKESITRRDNKSTEEGCDGNVHNVDSINNSKEVSHAQIQANYIQSEIDLLREPVWYDRGVLSFPDTLADARNRHHEIFSEEITNSYAGLSQANDILGRHLNDDDESNDCAHKTSTLAWKIQEMEQRVLEHKAIHSSLLEMIGSSDVLDEGRAPQMSKTESIEKASVNKCSTSSLSNVQQSKKSVRKKRKNEQSAAEMENEWIKGELRYFSSIIDNEKEAERKGVMSGAGFEEDLLDGSSIERKRSSRISSAENNTCFEIVNGPIAKRGRRKAPGVATEVIGAPESRLSSSGKIVSDHTWSIDHFLQELTCRLLHSSDDPYIALNEKIHPRGVVDMLIRCGVVEAHSHNDFLIRLVDFLE